MVYEILLEGISNAKTGRSICEFLNITPRELTVRIERERRGGKPICASCGSTPGYYIAETKSDMEAYCRSLKHREKEIHITRQACMKALKKLPERRGNFDKTQGNSRKQ